MNAAADLRQAELVAGVVERVDVALEERHLGVHPRAERTFDRLGHERRVDAELGGDLLHDLAERHHVVGHRERVGVAQVDLVLARSELVEAVLDRDAHRLERDDGLAAQLAHHVLLGEVEEAGVVERHRRVVGGLEDEELHLGRGVEGEALVAGPLEVALEHVARIALERLFREVLDVAEHAGDGGVLPTPGDDLEGARVGHGEHVGFLHPAVALDGRSVERHALLEGGLELGGGDREALERAEDIGEPEADEAHAPLLDGSQDVVELLLHADSLRTAT